MAIREALIGCSCFNEQFNDFFWVVEKGREVIAAPASSARGAQVPEKTFQAMLPCSHEKSFRAGLVADVGEFPLCLVRMKAWRHIINVIRSENRIKLVLFHHFFHNSARGATKTNLETFGIVAARLCECYSSMLWKHIACIIHNIYCAVLRNRKVV